MKKTIKSHAHWWNNTVFLSVASTLIVLLSLELLFSIPSRWIHTEQVQKIDIVREERPTKTNLSLDESPAFCSKEYVPVCGTDGRTYANRCMAGMAKVPVATTGECQGTQTGKALSGTQSTDPDKENVIETELIPKLSDIDYTDASKFHIYTNNAMKYSMSFPNYSYYQGYGARDGAAHSMAMGLDEASISNFDTAPVRVWFYRTKPATPPSDQSKTLENGIIYVSSQGESPKIEKIVTDIFASAK